MVFIGLYVLIIFTSSYCSFVSTSTFTTSWGVVRIFPKRASHSQCTKRVQVLNEETVFLIFFCPFLNLSVTDRILRISIGGRLTWYHVQRRQLRRVNKNRTWIRQLRNASPVKRIVWANKGSCTKRGKTLARLVCYLLLIGWQSGPKCWSQRPSSVKKSCHMHQANFKFPSFTVSGTVYNVASNV